MKIKIFFVIIFLFAACKDDRDMDLQLNYFHFTEYLFSTDSTTIDSRQLVWESELGSFGPYFDYYIMGRRDTNNLNYQKQILNFVNHNDMREVYDSICINFNDLEVLERDINLAFSRYADFFPEEDLPKIITLFSGFNYGVMAQDSIIAIGLDFFLGRNSKFYDYLGDPNYVKQQKEPEFILPYIMEVWYNQLFESDGTNFLSKMVEKGKLIYFLHKTLPEYSIANKLRFTQEELEWCEYNERAIWSYFIEEELLFSERESDFRSYLNYAPFAKGMPRDSPGRVAYYIGFRIVSSFMKKQSHISLEELIGMRDAQLILKESKYKPER